MTIGIISGGFDPVHVGHLAMIRHAKERCSKLIVGVNSDEWLARKKGRSFMPLQDRLAIMQAFRGVDTAMGFIDDDDTCVDLLVRVRQMHMHQPIEFYNGGDRNSATLPLREMEECQRLHIEPLFGIGGHVKLTSSSALLNDWTAS